MGTKYVTIKKMADRVGFEPESPVTISGTYRYKLTLCCYSCT